MQIIRDTREKIGLWSFGEIETIERKLDSGDYSLVGYESILCIERKKSVSEVAVNIGSDSVRFNKELERMKNFPLAYLICEFSLDEVLEFPNGSNIPKRLIQQVRIGGKFILKTLSSYKEKYGIEVIYAGDRDNAIELALGIFNDITKT